MTFKSSVLDYSSYSHVLGCPQIAAASLWRSTWFKGTNRLTAGSCYWEQRLSITNTNQTLFSECHVRNKWRKRNVSNILYSTQTNGYTLEGNYRADFNSTVPPLHYMCNNYNNKYPGSFGSCEILHCTKKRHFLCREIILHQICKSTLKHKSYLYYPMSQGTHTHTMFKYARETNWSN